MCTIENICCIACWLWHTNRVASRVHRSGFVRRSSNCRSVCPSLTLWRFLCSPCQIADGFNSIIVACTQHESSQAWLTLCHTPLDFLTFSGLWIVGQIPHISVKNAPPTYPELHGYNSWKTLVTPFNCCHFLVSDYLRNANGLKL